MNALREGNEGLASQSKLGVVARAEAMYLISELITSAKS